ncbi:MAG: hypothetical protein QM503_08865 [Bacteroidota bacterium]
MKKIFLLFGLIVLTQINLQAQKNIEYTRQIKAAYPTEDVVITKSSVIVEFEYKSKFGIVASEKRSEEFLSLEKNIAFVYPVFYSDDVRISGFKAGDGSRVGMDDYYTSNNVFHDDIKVKYSKFRLPYFGSISDIKATLSCDNIRYLSNIYFSSPLTILEKEVQFIIPFGIEIDLIPFNFENYNIVVTESQTKKGRVVTYKANNLASMADNFDLPGKSHIYPHIFIHVKSYQLDGSTVKVFETVDELYGWYNSLVADIGNDPDELIPLVNSLINEDQSDEEKIASIYYWVQDNIRYIAFEDGIAGFKPTSCNKVYNNMYGDCKGMANITKEMLTIAGFDVSLAWLGTRHLAYDYSIPSLSVDNHMICALELNGTLVYLDATEKYSRLGEYAERIQNQNVLIQDGDTYKLETIPKADVNQNIQHYEIDLTLNSDNIIEGKIVVNLSSEARAELMNILSTIPKKDWEKSLKYYLSSGNDLITVTDVKMPDINRDRAYEFSGNISMTDKVSAFDNEAYLYIDPFTFYSNYSTYDDRKFALWFDYKKNIELEIEFIVPEGWEIVSIPESLTIDNDEFSFNISYNQNNDVISYKMNTKIYEAKISANNLGNWNEAIKSINKTYEQPIILKKK